MWARQVRNPSAGRQCLTLRDVVCAVPHLRRDFQILPVRNVQFHCRGETLSLPCAIPLLSRGWCQVSPSPRKTACDRSSSLVFARPQRWRAREGPKGQRALARKRSVPCQCLPPPPLLRRLTSRTWSSIAASADDMGFNERPCMARMVRQSGDRNVFFRACSLGDSHWVCACGMSCLEI